MRCYVLMGVSGCGKSSVGTALSATCNVTFVDGDDLHPKCNIDKMTRGTPLDDADRAPWLADVGRLMAKYDGAVVVGCSALKRRYRDWIREEVDEPVHFLHLDAPKDVLSQRVASRPGHFMPPSLLDSQFATLERLEAGEWGSEIDIARPYDEVVAQSEEYVRGTMI
ncbi:gluconokinase [uncultured Tateyamaria sp.]|uniref:gluconokinase n=1 Tax=uncultured Tateyamaria sp. TaxID=455651 RepID=UPI00261F1418|nr:gluconokinase [uncultured Tateyamaria sp.]